ncbi:type IV pilus secretin PilQ [Frateuria aurantia]
MRFLPRLLLGVLIPSLASPVWAATPLLESVSSTTLPGNGVSLRLHFNQAPPVPNVTNTDTPPRLVFDFPGAKGMAASYLKVGVGAVEGVSTSSLTGRSRVVLDLYRSTRYRSHVEGHDLLVTVDGGDLSELNLQASSGDPTKVPLSTSDGVPLSNIDFRRQPNGGAKVTVSFGSPGAQIDLHQLPGKVVLDINHASLPAFLRKQLDVGDFATPVNSILSRQVRPGHVAVELAVNGEVSVASYQDGGQYVLDVVAKKAPAEVPTSGGLPGAQVYTGKRLTFNFQDVPVRSALQVIADVSGFNLVAADNVTGNLTLRLDNVPWDQALDLILQAKGLDKRRSGNVIWIAPQKEMASYEQSLTEARARSEDSADLVTAYIPISYGQASDIAKLLTQSSLQSNAAGSTNGAQSVNRGFLSPRGTVSFDVRTNTLLLSDVPEKVKEIRDLVARLDKPVQQVLIEARIVVATDNFERDLGAEFGVSGNKTTSSGNVVQLGSSIGGTQGSSSTNGSSTLGAGGLNVNLPLTSPAGSIGLALLGKNYAVDLELEAAQTEGRSELISSPRAVVANNQEADLQQGQQIGYVTYQNSTSGSTGSGTATVQFKNAVLELKVTPTITADNRVYLKIDVIKDALNSYYDVPGSGEVPIIDHRSMNTSVLVDNGQTVVLGGILELDKITSVTKVPGLGDIPILGALFRTTSRQNNKAELLIFVTPRILSNTLQ